jgi:hypothetical protein
MSAAGKERKAERWLFQRLTELLGPNRLGLAAYGLRFDPVSKSTYIGVDFEPNVPRSVLDQVPERIGDLDVRVRRLSLRLENHG